MGPGTGTFFVILLVAVIGYGFLQATVLTKLANLTTNVAALVVLGLTGHVLWGVGAVMAVANLTGGGIGARMASGTATASSARSSSSPCRPSP